jgi:hypothetical protein
VENKYVSTDFLISELICSVSRFSLFVSDLLTEKEEEDARGGGSRAERHAVEDGFISPLSGNRTTILQ